MAPYSYSKVPTIEWYNEDDSYGNHHDTSSAIAFNGTPASLVFHKTTPHYRFLPYEELVEHSIDLNLSFRLVIYMLYILIFVVGIIGNLLVVFVVFRQQTMHSVTNIFIANLALSDILLCLFCVPFTPLYLLTFKEWVFGSFFCHLVPFAQGVSVYISVLTLMMIALERYTVIVHPLLGLISIRNCYWIILFIWILAIVLTLPYGIFINVISIISHKPNVRNISTLYQDNDDDNGRSGIITNGSDHQTFDNNPVIIDRYAELVRSLQTQLFCHEMWPNDHLRLAFGMCTMVGQFVIPFCIITYCYTKVCMRLWNRVRSRPGTNNISSQRKWLEKERARRTNTMLICMVIIFVVSWLPLNTYNLVEDIYGSISSWKHSKTIFVTFHLIAMSSAVYHPFFTTLSDNFRKEFKIIFISLSNWCWFMKRNENVTQHSKELRTRGTNQNLGQSNLLRKTNDTTKNCTQITELKGTERKDEMNGDEDGECISMTVLDTTTNLVTNLESINEAELQESLLVTSVHNGIYANRVLSSIKPNTNGIDCIQKL